jgi:hypothetical protein
MGAFVVSCCERLLDVFGGAPLALPEFEQEITIQSAIARNAFESVSDVNTIEVFDWRFSSSSRRRCAGR